MKPTILVTILALAGPASAQPTERDPGPLLSTSQVRSPPPPPVADPEYWLTVGPFVTSRGFGIRVQHDLLAGSTWSAGLAGSLVPDGESVMGVDVPLAVGVAYVARTSPLVGPFRLRAQLGLGGQVGSTTSIVVEGALLASAPFGHHFAVVAGPILEVSGDATAMMFVGVQHR
jgi:hypothetical protein